MNELNISYHASQGVQGPIPNFFNIFDAALGILQSAAIAGVALVRPDRSSCRYTAAMAQKAAVELSRRVRLCLNPGLSLAELRAAPRHNTFAGWPGMLGLGVFYEIEVRCRGWPDGETGYLMNISTIDEHVRRIALPLLHEALAQHPLSEPAGVLRTITAQLQDALGDRLAEVALHLTPYHCVSMSASEPDHVMISQQFEFASAHRLHVDSLTAEENRTIFGKCNHPNYHGHNYRLEVAVNIPLTLEQTHFAIAELERIVHEQVIERLDHKNLNIDVSEFGNLNPSVENIAKVCFELVDDALARNGAELSHVTVWETEKTSCTYPVRR